VRKERKVVTVLFADLVGFTARSEQLDPEDVEAILEPYHARLRAELERHGGTVEKFIGDAVMAIFGAPVGREDDAERAVRAALAIRDAAADGGFEVRIGVNTGEALVSVDARPEAGDKMAAGDVVNTAARLQSAAPVNGILVGDATERATRHVIAYGDHEPIEAKGKAEPVAVWEAVEARSRFGVDVRQHGGARLVGRERELDALGSALERARGQREPQLVTIVGVPGIGKSRLVWELFQVVDRDPELITWRQGRCLPYGEGVSFWALGEMVKAHAGILETDQPEEVEGKLDEAVGDARLARHLRPLVGLSADQELGGDRRVEAFAAWRELFERIADEGPLVLVFDDLHWADDGLLDFVDHLAEWARGVPLLVLCSARPELHERRPGWGGGKLNAQTLALAPLADSDAARLIGELLGQALLPAETQAALLERAGGNPLYAEQYALLYRERGSAERLPLPDTVQGIVAARIDGLPPGEKRVLQDAAVVGKVFWTGALGADRHELNQRLHALERKEFVRRERRSSVEEEDEYAFRHVLVRDVAYGQLPRADRAERHVAAAGWLESLGRAQDHADLLAHHYASALDLTRAAGGDAAPLADRAGTAFCAAGDRALSLNAFASAVAHYGRALELAGEDDASLLFRYGVARFHSAEEGEDELSRSVEALLAAGDAESAVEAQVLLVELAWKRGDRQTTDERLEQVERIASGLETSRAKAYALSTASRFHMLAGQSAEAVRLGETALAMATELALDELRIHALTNVGPARAHLGDLPRGIANLEEALAIGKPLGSPEVLRSYVNLAASVANAGDIRRCDELHREALELANRLGHAPSLRFLTAELASNAYFLGNWQTVLDTAGTYEAEAAAGRPHYLLQSLLTLRSAVRLARGDLEGGLSDAVRALALGREVGRPAGAGAGARTVHPRAHGGRTRGRRPQAARRSVRRRDTHRLRLPAATCTGGSGARSARRVRRCDGRGSREPLEGRNGEAAPWRSGRRRNLRAGRSPSRRGVRASLGGRGAACGGPACRGRRAARAGACLLALGGREPLRRRGGSASGPGGDGVGQVSRLQLFGSEELGDGTAPHYQRRRFEPGDGNAPPALLEGQRRLRSCRSRDGAVRQPARLGRRPRLEENEGLRANAACGHHGGERAQAAGDDAERPRKESRVAGDGGLVVQHRRLGDVEPRLEVDRLAVPALPDAGRLPGPVHE
jgi:class 3 adenylate cyclase/tetratricopeptide (TPR) repeat protein